MGIGLRFLTGDGASVSYCLLVLVLPQCHISHLYAPVMHVGVTHESYKGQKQDRD